MGINYQLQDQFLDRFFTLSLSEKFYLTGGTALARFYYHHRESVDLDLFTQNQTQDFNELNLKVIKTGEDLRLKLDRQINTPQFLQYVFLNPQGDALKIDFVKDIPRHFGELRQFGKTRVDSIENIGSNKILAVFGRTDLKDFIDLYYILKNSSFTFDHLYGLAKQKDLGLTEFYLANSLNQFDPSLPSPILLKPVSIQALQKFYNDLTKELLLKAKPQDTS